MSHFAVLVATKDGEGPAQYLAPFNEQPGEGSPYLKFVVKFTPDAISAEAARIREENPDAAPKGSDEKVLRWYCGGCADEAGNWGHWRNPDAKWDWWEIGGRWSNLLRLKDGSRADRAGAGEVDWEAIRREQLDRRMERHAAYHRVRAEVWAEPLPEGWPTEKMREGYEEDSPRGETVRRLYPSVEDYARGRRLDRRLLDGHGILLLTFDEEETLRLPREEYVERFQGEALTHAFIGLDGKWHEAGEMGCFAIVLSETPGYDQEWWEFVRSLPQDCKVYVVDCHI